MKTACETAVEKGILVVAAAGNDGTRVNNYPAAYDCVIGVASLDEDGQPSYFSQYGDSVYVAAPGGKVTSVLNEASKYVTGSGTSYACPEVVALGAMARSVFPEMNQNEFKQLLQETCQDKGDEGFDIYYGWGLVDFGKASEYLLEKAYVPAYHLSFDIDDQDGEKLDGVDIRLEAAEDIEWEDDEEAGIKAGKWEKGHVIEPEKDGEYAGTYTLHKGKYKYVLEKEGYWTKESRITTLSENQKERTSLEKTYDVSLDIIDSEKDKLDGAEITLTKTSDSLSSEVKQSENGAYSIQVPEGTYKYDVKVKGYETKSAYLTVKREALDETIMVHTSGEISTVDFSCISGTEKEPGEAISNVSVSVKDSQGNRIPAVSDGVYQLVRGEKYTYTAARAGYEDEIGKIKVANSDKQTIKVYMQASTLYAVIKAVDSDGNEIEDADVILRDSNGDEVSPVKTDNSRYNLQRGTYSYTVNCDGYSTEKGSFEMGRYDSYREINIVMSKITSKAEIYVSDETGASADGADISVFDRKGNLQAKSADGTYRLADGRYTYTVYLKGYDAGTGSFTMSGKAADRIKVEAKSTDGGELTYQWYASKYRDGKGDPVKGQTSELCEISTEEAGTLYYYAAVTNRKDTGNGQTDTVKVKTERIAITVIDRDKLDAQAVSEKIAAIPGGISFETESQIAEARAAYDALTDNAKAQVEGLDKLEAAEKKLAELRAKAAAAYEVSKQIESIGTVTLDKEEQIKAAREAYEALADDVKAMVEGLDILEAAEKKIPELKKEAATPAALRKTEKTADFRIVRDISEIVSYR